MTSGSHEYEESVLGDLSDYSDLIKTKHASFIERQLIRSASPDVLHPNPDDEFCNPAIGPSEKIVAHYKEFLLKCQRLQTFEQIEPITVSKLSTG